MAFYNQLELGCWRDRKLRLLSKDEKLFFFFLLTLPDMSVAGLCHTTPEKLAAESYGDWTPAEVRKLLAGLQKPPLIVYDREWLWVIGLFKRRGININTFKSAKASLEECESKIIFEKWWQKYRNVQEVAKSFGRLAFKGEPMPLPGEEPPAPLGAIKPEPKPLHLLRAEVDAVWEHYLRVHSANVMLKLTDKRRAMILTRLRDTVADPDTGEMRFVQVEDLMRAISNCGLSPFHMGLEAKTNGQKYNSLEQHILHSYEQFEKWLHFVPPIPPPPVKGTPFKKKEVVPIEPKGCPAVACPECARVNCPCPGCEQIADDARRQVGKALGASLIPPSAPRPAAPLPTPPRQEPAEATLNLEDNS